MANNLILPFAPTDTGTNLDTQAAYLAATDRTNGNQPGVARSKLVNKALRQSALMAAGLAQYLADRQTVDISDATLLPSDIANMIAQRIFGVNAAKAVATPYTLIASDAGKLLICSGTGVVTCPTNVFAAGTGVLLSAGSGTDNVSLVPSVGSQFSYGGTARTSIILGNNENVSIISQGNTNAWIVSSGGLRSSSDFSFLASANGYAKLPSDILLQWGTGVTSAAGDITIGFPIGFSSVVYSMSGAIISGATGYALGFSSITTTQFNLSTWANNTTRGNSNTYWTAIGK